MALGRRLDLVGRVAEPGTRSRLLVLVRSGAEAAAPGNVADKPRQADGGWKRGW